MLDRRGLAHAGAFGQGKGDGRLRCALQQAGDKASNAEVAPAGRKLAMCVRYVDPIVPGTRRAWSPSPWRHGGRSRGHGVQPDSSAWGAPCDSRVPVRGECNALTTRGLQLLDLAGHLLVGGAYPCVPELGHIQPLYATEYCASIDRPESASRLNDASPWLITAWRGLGGARDARRPDHKWQGI